MPNEKTTHDSTAENMTNQNIPELKQLRSLQDSVEENNSQISNNMNVLRKDISSIAINIDLSEIEQSAVIFIRDELTKSGLLKKVEESNKRVSGLLEKINFFGGITSVVSGVFSHGFSKEDNEKWSEIERAFREIYDSNNGVLKKVQDYFLFRIEREQILKFLDKKEISFEEELFIRSILIKGYLNNFRQLILPFYEISDDVLVKFKKERIKCLKEKEQNDNDVAEITLLEKQIQKLESQNLTQANKQSELQKRISAATAEITINNTTLNTGSVVLGTVETARYVTSFVGHKAGWEVLKTVGSFGVKASSFFAKCLPIISGVVEVGTQLNNNRIVYNYEKKLKILSIIDNTKRNLLILEQQVTDYYIDNILNRLQTIMIENQVRTQEIVTNTYNQQLAIIGEGVTQEQFDLVKQEYFQNVDLVRRGVEQIYETKMEEKNTFYQNKIKEEERVINQKDNVITEKEAKLVELDKELFNLNVELEKKRKELDREVSERSKQITHLNNSIGSLSENLSFSRDLLEKEKQSLRVQEKALQESLKGNISDSFQAAFNYEVDKRKEFEATLNVLIQQKIELTESLKNAKADLKSKEEELTSEKDYGQVLNERLSARLENAKREKLAIEKQLNEQRIGYEKRINELSQKYIKIDDEHTKLKGDQVILEDALEKAKVSVADEIETGKKYRTKIKELQKEVGDFAKLTQDFQKLEKINNSDKRKLSELEQEKQKLEQNLLQESRIKNDLLVESENLKKRDVNLKNQIDETLNRRKFFSEISDSLESAVNKITAEQIANEKHVPTSADKFVSIITTPYHWVSNKVGTGLAIAGFVTVLPTLLAAFGWLLRSWVAYKSGGVSELANSLGKNRNPKNNVIEAEVSTDSSSSFPNNNSPVNIHISSLPNSPKNLPTKKTRKKKTNSN